MITYTDTTVFNTNAQTIVNTVNCQGVMGGGIALEFKLRYPEMFEDYTQRCAYDQVKIGRPLLYCAYEYIWILNFPTKKHWKRPSDIMWIRQGLEYFVSNYERAGIVSIAFPQLGCGKGGLNWADVQPVMEEYLHHIPIPIYICLDTEVYATGIEKEMVDLLNQQTETTLQDELGVQPKIASTLVSHLPIKRFRELRQMAGVGKKTYEQIFKELYHQATGHQKNSDKTTPSETECQVKQLSMF
jgi:O-acetyl-ADP-ribose deacetylase (regulator of RNase III)